MPWLPEDNDHLRNNTLGNSTPPDFSGESLLTQTLQNNTGQTGTVKSPDKPDKLNSDRWNADRKNTLNSNKFGPFDAPFDFRIQDAYVDNIPLGNNMPGDPDMIGSPTLMNPFAIIRYHHIANMNHYQKTFDYVGNHDFKGNSISQPLHRDSAEGQALVNLRKNSMVMQDGGEDEHGYLYELYRDETMREWLHKGSNEVLMVLPEGEDPRKWDDIKILENQGYKKCPAKCGLFLIPIDSDCTTNKEVNKLCEKIQNDVEAENNRLKEIEQRKNFAENKIKQAKEQAISNKDLIQGDHPTTRKYIFPDVETPVQEKEMKPTFDNLCNMDNWSGDEQFFYKYADFMWCTNYYNIPNNRLITLRRFPVPVYDHGRIPDQDSSRKYMLPIARAVTWIDGDKNQLSDFYEMSWNYNWKDVEAEINDVQNFNEGQTPDIGGFAGGIGKALDFVNRLSNSGKMGMGSMREWDGQEQELWQVDPYQNGPKANLVNGPVNAITKTKMRDRGLDFSQSFTIVFSYELKSFGGVNPKVAMLDIIANFLALTYNNAGFWGGANRHFPNRKNYPFLGARKGANAFMRGDVGGWITAIGEQFASAMSKIGNILSNMFTNPIDTLLNLGETAAKGWMAKKSANMRPQVLGVKSLLTGEPVGEWHLMVGNPFNPSLMIGNLIVTGAGLRVADDAYIGADDFPSKWEMEVTLDHGKPRDKGDIESMFNRGYGRLHYAPFGSGDEAWNNAYSTQNSNRSVKRGTYKVGWDVSNATSSATNQAPIVKEPPKENKFPPARSRMAAARGSTVTYYSNIFRNFGNNVKGGADAVKLAVETGFKGWKENAKKTGKQID